MFYMCYICDVCPKVMFSFHARHNIVIFISSSYLVRVASRDLAPARSIDAAMLFSSRAAALGASAPRARERRLIRAVDGSSHGALARPRAVRRPRAPPIRRKMTLILSVRAASASRSWAWARAGGPRGRAGGRALPTPNIALNAPAVTLERSRAGTDGVCLE